MALPPATRGKGKRVKKNVCLTSEEERQVLDLAAIDTDGNVSAQLEWLILSEYERRGAELRRAALLPPLKTVRRNVRLGARIVKQGIELARLDSRGNFSLEMARLIVREHRRRFPDGLSGQNGHHHPVGRLKI